MKLDLHIGLEFIIIVAGCFLTGIIGSLVWITLENFFKTYHNTQDKEKKGNRFYYLKGSIKYTYRLCRDVDWRQVLFNQAKSKSFARPDENPQSIILNKGKEFIQEELKHSTHYLHLKHIITGGKK